SLTVGVTGSRSARGSAQVCITTDPATFPDCQKDPHARHLSVPARNPAIMFANVAPGRYAVASFHDENANGRSDKVSMVPKEGFGFSRDAPVRFGPPRFSAAASTLGEGESSMSKAMHRGGASAPFRYPAFRSIWTANLFSNVGSTIQSVAAAWSMTDSTSSHVMVASVQASATIPIMSSGMIAGAIADNFHRRRLSSAAQPAMPPVSASLAASGYAGLVAPCSLLPPPPTLRTRPPPNG
ncbi:hypothetical protein OY671_008720, partial [Metschnikowia pulcherrima]